MKIVLAICVCLMIGCGEKSAKPKSYIPNEKDLALSRQMAESLEENAEAGNKIAQFQVGGMYFFGEYPKTKDFVASYAWTYISASNGWSIAEANKSTIAGSMTPDQIAKAMALVEEMIKKNPELIQKKE